MSTYVPPSTNITNVDTCDSYDHYYGDIGYEQEGRLHIPVNKTRPPLNSSYVVTHPPRCPERRDLSALYIRVATAFARNLRQNEKLRSEFNKRIFEDQLAAANIPFKTAILTLAITLVTSTAMAGTGFAELAQSKKWIGILKGISSAGAITHSIDGIGNSYRSKQEAQIELAKRVQQMLDEDVRNNSTSLRETIEDFKRAMANETESAKNSISAR